MGKAKVSTAALGSVAKVIVGSVDSEPHEHIMKRYYYGEREFFSGVSSITCALDGIRVGKTEYLFVVLAGRQVTATSALLALHLRTAGFCSWSVRGGNSWKRGGMFNTLDLFTPPSPLMYETCVL